MNKEISRYTLCSLLLKTNSSYEANLEKLLSLISNTAENSIVVAPEVCLTGFDYENFSKAQAFATKALTRLKEVSQDKIIIVTMIEEVQGKVYNMLKVIHNGEVIHTRAKARLFTLGGEEKYFTQGNDSDIAIIEIDGMKIAFLICFELRFKDLWKKCEGADVIAVPSWWGKLRGSHFVSLSQTLAIMNQCYVIASDSANEECSQMSGIITPMGEAKRNGNKPCLEVEYKAQEIKKMRRYMNVGIQ